MANSSGVGFLYFTTAGWTPEERGLFPEKPIDRQLVPTPLHQLTLDVLIIVSDIPLHTLAKSLGWFATASRCLFAIPLEALHYLQPQEKNN